MLATMRLEKEKLSPKEAGRWSARPQARCRRHFAGAESRRRRCGSEKQSARRRLRKKDKYQQVAIRTFLNRIDVAKLELEDVLQTVTLLKSLHHFDKLVPFIGAQVVLVPDLGDLELGLLLAVEDGELGVGVGTRLRLRSVAFLVAGTAVAVPLTSSSSAVTACPFSPLSIMLALGSVTR